MICENCKNYSEKFDYCVVIEYNVTGVSSAYHTGKCDKFEKGTASDEVLRREAHTVEYLKELGWEEF